ncbi:MAG: hypothetical protein HBSAPP03_13550 [Phycisphaerae bacterium]|nr:MAG: hypothetical protein HBSAPP03_13550 [Phycisphaerae bacterium]
MRPIALLVLFLTLPGIAQPPIQPAPSPTPPVPSVPAEDAGYHLASGPCRVTTLDTLILHDEARGKDLRVKVRVPVPDPPAAAGSLPLVVFSHGLGGSKDVFADLCQHLATHGYIVIAPSHADSIIERSRQGERVTRDTAFDIRQMTPKAKWERVADVTFILDSLDELERRVDALRTPEGAGRIDRTRLAVAGHSAGAMTTQLIGGMKSRDPQNPAGTSKADPRLKAAVVISGQGVNGLGIREGAWDDVKIPWLVITGSLDTVSISNETPQTRRHPFEKARGVAQGGPPTYLLWIEGATHASYQGKSATRLLRESPTTDLDVIEACVKSAVLAFLDRHVKGDPNAEEALSDERFQRLSDGAARLERK